MASLVAAASLLVAQPAGAVELIQDGSFEAAFDSGGDSPFWIEYDTVFGTPLCTTGVCSDGGGTAGPRTGGVWAWFGGSGDGGEHHQYVAQHVTIPDGTATLSFYLWIGAAGNDELLLARIDETVLFGAYSTSSGFSSYTKVTRDASEFADGNTHVVIIVFRDDDTGTGAATMNVDDVSLNTEPPAPPSPPEAQPGDSTPPESTITKGPKDKTKKKTATFEFTSSEPGSSFECSFDDKPFAPCVSPEDEKVGKGKHTFAVRAVDPAGNIDPTPATDTWKVKKKRKK